MLAKVYSYGINGLDAYPVCIEVDVSGGLPATIIVGLPDSAIRESKERIRAAIKNSGYKYPARRITVNLSPANTKKEGPSFDLAICLGILAASEEVHLTRFDQYAFLGELSLDGHIKPIKGALAIALACRPFQGLIVPQANAAEAALADSIRIYPVQTINQVIQFLHNPAAISPFQINHEEIFRQTNQHTVDFHEVKGQTSVKRGLEIAAAGSHNVLLIGPPGSGKSMLAKRLPTILPDMTLPEALEITKIHSATGFLKPGQQIVATRPFRSPHHTTSDVAIVGGGPYCKPGEVTLSHHGVLFLDELPEFNRNVLEALRQPLEDHHATIARAQKTVRMPAQFMLIAAMNPCPCGFYTEPKKVCRCTSQQIQKYLGKISGPLWDRIDIHLDVPSLPSQELLSYPPAENSSAIKERAARARQIQQQRSSVNAYLTPKQIKEYCPLNAEGKCLLKDAIEKFGLSARAYDKILKVARTIADLASEENILIEHLAEAIQYRTLDRGWL